MIGKLPRSKSCSSMFLHYIKLHHLLYNPYLVGTRWYIHIYIYVVYSLKGAGFFHLNEIVQYYQLYIQYNLSRNFGDSIRIQLAHILQALPSYNSSHSQFNPRTKTYRMSQKKCKLYCYYCYKSLCSNSSILPPSYWTISLYIELFTNLPRLPSVSQKHPMPWRCCSGDCGDSKVGCRESLTKVIQEDWHLFSLTDLGISEIPPR